MAEHQPRSGAGPGPQRRIGAALRALAQYREGRAFDGAAPDCLLERLESTADDSARHRRRAELVGRAVMEQRMPHWLAEEIYDVAREEGLDPAFAFELVRCGVAVCGPEGETPDAPEQVQGDPNWLAAAPPVPDAARERRLRTSFRRLRSLFDRSETAEEALIAFAREPDVGTCGY